MPVQYVSQYFGIIGGIHWVAQKRRLDCHDQPMRSRGIGQDHLSGQGFALASRFRLWNQVRIAAYDAHRLARRVEDALLAVAQTGWTMKLRIHPATPVSSGAWSDSRVTGTGGGCRRCTCRHPTQQTAAVRTNIASSNPVGMASASPAKL